MFCKLLIEVIYRRQSSSFFFFSPFSFRGDVWDAWAYLFIVLSQNVIPTVRQDVQSCQIFRHPLMTRADEQKPVNFGYRFRFEKRRSIPKTGNVTPMIPNGQHNSQSYHSERWVHESLPQSNPCFKITFPDSKEVFNTYSNANATLPVQPNHTK